ncbi:hypothetical protein RHSIM_Rhsim05G0035900 [Rhododendron simsii]|uniref:Uncharacterized protein n=1 Tax=Rhododendron simsii TaxID=118357 RepID=A0A834LMR1_RHOSS|nr:hypothetical protein RHSIM_Rhsim05G0035900 [Rhododendron simsii]
MGSEHWAKGFGNQESGFESGVPAVQDSRFRDLQSSSFQRMETPPQTTQELRNSRSTHLEQFPTKATGYGRFPANRELAFLIPSGCTPVTDAYRSLAKQVGAFAVSHLPIHKILPLPAHYVNQMSNVPDGEGRGMTFSIPQRNVFFDEGMQRMVLGPLRPIFLQRKNPKWTRLFKAFTILLYILQEHPPRKTLPTTFVNALEQAFTFLQELMDMWVASPPMITKELTMTALENGILWLGLRPSDLETYHLPQDVYTDLVDDDRTTASSLL